MTKKQIVLLVLDQMRRRGQKITKLVVVVVVVPSSTSQTKPKIKWIKAIYPSTLHGNPHGINAAIAGKEHKK